MANTHRQNQPLNELPDPWATNMLTMKRENKEPGDFARELPSCPVRLETLAGQMHTPAFARLAAKAAAVATAAIATAPETPGSLRPVLASARTVTRTGYMATKVTGGSGWKTLLIGVVLAVIGGVMATQGLIAIGLTGTIIALVGLYLIALGAWGIHRGLLGALIAITTLALAGSLTLAWVRKQIWGSIPKGSSGLVPKHVLPWLQSAAGGEGWPSLAASSCSPRCSACSPVAGPAATAARKVRSPRPRGPFNSVSRGRRLRNSPSAGLSWCT